MSRGRERAACLVALAAAAVLAWIPAALEGAEATEQGGGGSLTADGTPTYRVAPDGTVDWRTYSGFRRYHSECHMCHGPDGEGGSFAPSLLEPLRAMSYGRFRDIIANGGRDVGPARQQVMRAMGEDPNVMCYLDDIYAYLKARADQALGRGRPQRHEPKPAVAARNETACPG